MGSPRHIGQHNGGLVIEAATGLCRRRRGWPAGVIIQWDKDDVADMRMIKVDCLVWAYLPPFPRPSSLFPTRSKRDLAGIVNTRCLGLRRLTRSAYSRSSRAQIATLPRMRPRCFYDLVIKSPSSGRGRLSERWSSFRRRCGRPQSDTPHLPRRERTLRFRSSRSN